MDGMGTAHWQESRVRRWVNYTLGEQAMTPRARALRLVEEAIEVGQCCGLSSLDVERLTGLVYSKPRGDVAQEIGGVAVCLFGVAAAFEMRVAPLAEAELVRIESGPARKFRDRERQNVAHGVGVEPKAEPVDFAVASPAEKKSVDV